MSRILGIVGAAIVGEWIWSASAWPAEKSTTSDKSPAAAKSAKGPRRWEIMTVHPSGPNDFVPPDRMKKDRPDLVAAVKGVKVYTDIEYVPGGGQPQALDVFVRSR